jgi:hypothetical protein
LTVNRFIVQLSWLFDLDVGRGTLAVNAGKGGRSRVVPTGDRAVGWCEKWMIDGRPQLAVPPDDVIDRQPLHRPVVLGVDAERTVQFIGPPRRG